MNNEQNAIMNLLKTIYHAILDTGTTVTIEIIAFTIG